MILEVNMNTEVHYLNYPELNINTEIDSTINKIREPKYHFYVLEYHIYIFVILTVSTIYH